MKSFNNYENETFTEVTEEVVGCNIKNCTIDIENTPVFSKCNLDNCKVLKPATFNLSNLRDCELCDGCTLYKSNVIDSKEEEEREKHMHEHDAE